MDPLGAVPDPVKVTDCPGVMNTLLAGLLIVPVGGISVGAVETCTNFAMDGTPEELIRKSM